MSSFPLCLSYSETWTLVCGNIDVQDNPDQQKYSLSHRPCKRRLAGTRTASVWFDRACQGIPVSVQSPCRCGRGVHVVRPTTLVGSSRTLSTTSRQDPRRPPMGSIAVVSWQNTAAATSCKPLCKELHRNLSTHAPLTPRETSRSSQRPENADIDTTPSWWAMWPLMPYRNIVKQQ